MALITSPLRIGYVPEHFSTPLYFAQRYFGLNAELIAFPSGTGAMISALRERRIDVSIGLTEGFIAGLGTKKLPNGEIKREGGYSMIGTYVESPLCWAISTGANRKDITSVDALRGRNMGVSRLGSGSHIMGSVLADQHQWFTGNPTQPPFTAVPQQDFAGLRKAVNDGRIDFFMWEYYTSKRYFAPDTQPTSSPPSIRQGTSPSLESSGMHTPSSAVHSGSSFNLQPSLTSPAPQPLGSPAFQPSAPQFPPVGNNLIRQVGEIYTPWPSWHIVARHPSDARLPGFFQSLNRGIDYFEHHQGEAVDYISSELDYTREDAQSWLNTVDFARQTGGVRVKVVEQTVALLQKAGVLVETREPEELTRMIGEQFMILEENPEVQQQPQQQQQRPQRSSLQTNLQGGMQGEMQDVPDVQMR